MCFRCATIALHVVNVFGMRLATIMYETISYLLEFSRSKYTSNKFLSSNSLIRNNI